MEGSRTAAAGPSSTGRLRGCVTHPQLPHEATRTIHEWAQENPCTTHRRGYQQRFSVNVRAGTADNQVVGPYMMPPRLNSVMYRTVLREVLVQLLEEVPLWIRQDMCNQHGREPHHSSAAVREHLNNIFPDRRIGRSVLVSWPARSPDLKPMDINSWGCMNAITGRSNAEARGIAGTLAILDSLRHAMLRHCAACFYAEGGHFEQLL
ncbi:hypothetical protein PR048_016767 [Dryococelus australis]|uniref:Uncharacterized protein n=1 Tax=Dryococelus australis TaxID=614101 RepID=A0ABQ9H7Q9_9NEOP|nr:hypothetical protein PR048_016767 [Dryococelus australis]